MVQTCSTFRSSAANVITMMRQIINLLAAFICNPGNDDSSPGSDSDMGSDNDSDMYSQHSDEYFIFPEDCSVDM